MAFLFPKALTFFCLLLIIGIAAAPTEEKIKTLAGPSTLNDDNEAIMRAASYQEADLGPWDFNHELGPTYEIPFDMFKGGHCVHIHRTAGMEQDTAPRGSDTSDAPKGELLVEVILLEDGLYARQDYDKRLHALVSSDGKKLWRPEGGMSPICYREPGHTFIGEWPKGQDHIFIHFVLPA